MTMNFNILNTEMLRCVVDMLVCERCHEEVTVIVVWLHPQLDTVSVSSLPCRLNKVLW